MTFTERKALEDRCVQRLPGLAAALGTGWTADAGHSWGFGRLVHAETGHVLYLAIDQGGKLSVDVGWPKDADGSVTTPGDYGAWRGKKWSIGVSLTKTNDQIAKAVVSRLLPDYTKAFAECRQRIDAAQDYADKTRRTAQTLAASVGGTCQPCYWHGDKTVIDRQDVTFEMPQVYECIVMGDDVKLQLRLSESEALAVLNLLKSFAQ